VRFTATRDKVILRPDGSPAGELAAAVDDHLMGVTHVIRSEVWLTSAPYYVRLCQAFGWDVPDFYHLGLLRDPSGSPLLRGATYTVDHYRMKVTAEAFLTALVRAASATMKPPDGYTPQTLPALISSFDWAGMTWGGPIFTPPR